MESSYLLFSIKKRYSFSTFPVVCIDQPYFIFLFSIVSPKLICLQGTVMSALRFDCIMGQG